jgi:hypothetical protein
MFSSLSKPFTVAWLDISEAYLLVFGVVLLAGLIGELLADRERKKHSISQKQKRLFEEFENLRPPAPPDSIFKKYKSFFAALVIIGVVGECFSEAGIFVFGRQLQIIADVEVAQLNKEAELARLETVKIKQKMANLDASKWPVHSVTAEVRLRFENRQELDCDLNFTARLTISPSENVGPGRKVLLFCKNANEVKTDPWPMHILLFSSAIRPVPLPGAIGLLRLSAETACETMNTISLQITNFPISNVKVLSGSAGVTYNEVLRKRFVINAGEINNGFVVLTGTVNTNIPVEFLNSK